MKSYLNSYSACDFLTSRDLAGDEKDRTITSAYYFDAHVSTSQFFGVHLDAYKVMG